MRVDILQNKRVGIFVKVANNLSEWIRVNPAFELREIRWQA